MQKLKIKKNWQQRFSERLNREFNAYRKEAPSEMNRAIQIGFKDCLYLLGESLNKEAYSFANGFEKFCNDLEIKMEKR